LKALRATPNSVGDLLEISRTSLIPIRFAADWWSDAMDLRDWLIAMPGNHSKSTWRVATSKLPVSEGEKIGLVAIRQVFQVAKSRR
jgi:hypothetical protein